MIYSGREHNTRCMLTSEWLDSPSESSPLLRLVVRCKRIIREILTAVGTWNILELLWQLLVNHSLGNTGAESFGRYDSCNKADFHRFIPIFPVHVKNPRCSLAAQGICTQTTSSIEISSEEAKFDEGLSRSVKVFFIITEGESESSRNPPSTHETAASHFAFPINKRRSVRTRHSRMSRGLKISCLIWICTWNLRPRRWSSLTLTPVRHLEIAGEAVEFQHPGPGNFTIFTLRNGKSWKITTTSPCSIRFPGVFLGKMMKNPRTHWTIFHPFSPAVPWPEGIQLSHGRCHITEAKNGLHKLPRVAGSWARWALKSCQFNCCCMLLFFFWHPMYCSQSEFVQTCGGIPKEIEAVMIFYDGVPLRFHDSSGEWGFKSAKMAMLEYPALRPGYIASCSVPAMKWSEQKASTYGDWKKRERLNLENLWKFGLLSCRYFKPVIQWYTGSSWIIQPNFLFDQRVCIMKRAPSRQGAGSSSGADVPPIRSLVCWEHPVARWESVSCCIVMVARPFMNCGQRRVNPHRAMFDGGLVSSIAKYCGMCIYTERDIIPASGHSLLNPESVWACLMAF